MNPVAERNVIWTPTERQQEFLSAPEREILYGGASGGGKTDSLLCCALSQVNNRAHRAIFFRRSFPQLRSAIERSHELFRPLGGVFNIQSSTWSFSSGAKIEFAFLDSPTDQWRYAGRSFNCILWDELCEWPNDSAYVYLLSRLRTTKGSGLSLEVRSSANPLGPGSTWVRQRSKIPGDGGPSECVDEATGFHRRFIPARIDDNDHLLGSDHMRMLEAMPSAHRTALLEAVGIAFPVPCSKSSRTPNMCATLFPSRPVGASGAARTMDFDLLPLCFGFRTTATVRTRFMSSPNFSLQG